MSKSHHYEPIIDLQDKVSATGASCDSGAHVRAVLQLNAIIRRGSQINLQVPSHRCAMLSRRGGCLSEYCDRCLERYVAILTSAYAKRNYKDMRRIYSTSLRKGALLRPPLALLFAVLAEETMEAIFQWKGRFLRISD